ncbi:MAG: hypothetical protein WCG35_00710 [Betaproteobacteria bacterium]
MKKNDFFVGHNDKDTDQVAGRLPVAYQLELHRIIELEAYFRAEKDGFRRGPLDYWLAVEKDASIEAKA